MFSTDIQEISKIQNRYRDEGAIYLGSINSVKLLNQKPYSEIKTVISCLSSQEILKLEISSEITHKIIKLRDKSTENIFTHFQHVNNFIGNRIKKGDILIHCNQGVSRSATILAAYIMQTKNCSTESALNLLKQKRFQVEPNCKFMKDLKKFEIYLFKRIKQYQNNLM